MSIEELIALSVAALAAELEAGEYSAEQLNEALAAEIAGENRSTAIKEIKAALADTMTDDEPKGRKPGVYVCDGKAITTRAGMKSSGDEITEGMVADESLEKLIKKGFLEVQE